VTISELPNDVLLEIFSFYQDDQRDTGSEYEDTSAWHALVHMCRRWRCLVFASPRRLGLQLFFTDSSSSKEALGVWPELPIAIHVSNFGPWHPPLQALVNNTIAALEQHNRVRKIRLRGDPIPMLKTFSAMKKPFPSLVKLVLKSDVIQGQIQGSMIPDSFLGGSAPRLQSLEFDSIPCPEIGKLLLSTPNLVFLRLGLIPHSGQGYTSPEAMVNGLSMLKRLKSLCLTFHWETSRPQSQQESEHPPHFAPVVLPTLTDINFFGDKEYLEDIVSRIDTPLLANIAISFIDRPVSVTSPLRDFIGRTETFGAYSKIDTYPQAYVYPSDGRTKIEFFRPDGV